FRALSHRPYKNIRLRLSARLHPWRGVPPSQRQRQTLGARCSRLLSQRSPVLVREPRGSFIPPTSSIPSVLEIGPRLGASAKIRSRRGYDHRGDREYLNRA